MTTNNSSQPFLPWFDRTKQIWWISPTVSLGTEWLVWSTQQQVSELTEDQQRTQQRCVERGKTYNRPLDYINNLCRVEKYELIAFKENADGKIIKVVYKDKTNKNSKTKSLDINNYSISEERAHNDDEDSINYLIKNLSLGAKVLKEEEFFVKKVLEYYFRYYNT